jgi:hypothetical protein
MQNVADVNHEQRKTLLWSSAPSRSSARNLQCAFWIFFVFFWHELRSEVGRSGQNNHTLGQEISQKKDENKEDG